MKILFIEPTRYLNNGKLLKLKILSIPSLTLPLLAALTPDEVDVEIAIELAEDINFDCKVDLVGITSYTTNVYRAYEIADEFRRRKVPVIMGGMHVSMEPEEALEHADSVIIGEAEETWPQFINDFRNGRQKKVYEAKERPSLISLPVPRFSLLYKYRYLSFKKAGVLSFLLRSVIPIETARGCPHSCDFCCATKYFGSKYRPRPIADVVNEIKTLGAPNCYFVDDNIFANPPRAKELFKALIPLKIHWLGQATINVAEDKELLKLARMSGCSALCIGLESLSRQSLESVGKKTNKVEYYERHLKTIRREGISIAVGMMFGFDDEEPGVFKESYEFLVKNRIPVASWWPIIPYPGTPLYQRLKDQGRLNDDRWWLNSYSTAYSLRFKGTKMEDKLFVKNFHHYYRHFYSLKSIMRRILFPPQRRCFSLILFNLGSRIRITPHANILEH